MRRLTWLLVLAATGCAGIAEPTTTSGGGPPSSVTTGAPETTQPGPIDGSTSTTSGRDIAPDFVLALHAGGSYTLSEAAKPVYLVFWAEWCPTCRLELPIVDAISVDYAETVDFVAPAWKSGEEAAVAAAADLFPSGNIKWGLDPDEIIFQAYGVPYQPVTVLIGADQTVVETWAGVRPEAEIRASLDRLVALGG
jgi:hypothetical protein